MQRCAPGILLVAAFLTGTNAAAEPCDEVARLAMPSASITSAQVVAAGALPVPAGTPPLLAELFPTLPAFCRVSLTLRPSADSDIKTEVWLPVANWNGKLQVAGNGDWAGVLPYGGMASALAAGYATAGTDTGHVGNNADFVPGHPEKLVDFAYRAIHETTVAAKALLTAHYGRAPTFSYFRGCSTGGRQALTSAQRYPQDFDGLVAVASAAYAMRNHGMRLVFNNVMNRSAGSAIPAETYPIVHQAVLNACDALDGVEDGVIENPTKCRVDFETLACGGEETRACLTADQIESARVMMSPVTDARSGAAAWEGHLWPGSELRWDVLGGPRPFPNAVTAMKNLLNGGDAQWDPRTFTAADIERADRADGELLDASNADLTPFFKRGGKLLMFHGWADPSVTPQTSTIYFTSVLKTLGRSAENAIALFMMPGVYHCAGGGPGPDRFDRMADIVRWVEHGRKPTRIVVSHVTDGKVDRTRPLCPFGQVARWNGSGSTDDEKNFACVAETVDTAARPALSPPAQPNDPDF
ncbi:Tannase and feruloyl esterase [Luteitalea pratensis]|uniref:Tannase and feruloyl esterase n=1 Tax=Luteitalea pratensis TaxID=1855912 RepID=A0A143PMU3_LUTPR|nr:tannase/feruloyl esterase family alpha/beta hydrolase [Luteitalea pratensis]AMY09480.1 Tannase and feruloyl esterase [Luteitalea pratensis]